MHTTFAVVTILLFNICFLLLFSKSEKPLADIWKVSLHSNDTMLLLAGLWLIEITHFTPLGNANWLGTKILLLLVYIGLGVVIMRVRPRSPKFFVTHLLAMACADNIVCLVTYKPL